MDAILDIAIICSIENLYVYPWVNAVRRMIRRLPASVQTGLHWKIVRRVFFFLNITEQNWYYFDLSAKRLQMSQKNWYYCDLSAKRLQTSIKVEIYLITAWIFKQNLVLRFKYSTTSIKNLAFFFYHKLC